MATRKKNGASVDGAGSILSTVSGPSTAPPPSSMGAKNPVADQLLQKTAAAQELSAKMPFNPTKPGEYGDAAYTPQPGDTHEPSTAAATGSTNTETVASAKVGSGVPPAGANGTNDPLDRVRVDAGGQGLTTNQGVPIADNQNSLKIGLRGPTALEDFILREKITHFDHERIPERVVHARGSAAHGYFEAYKDLSDLTRASLFNQAGKRT
ncbi:MAG: catalase, partial [Telluria sp.]